MNPDVQHVADRQAIQNVLYTYCRALDRMDRNLALSVFNPGAVVHYHGMFEGTCQGFIDWVWQAHAGMQRHCHQVSNILIDLDGDLATSEAYVTITLWLNADQQGRTFESLNHGRYLDRWRRVDGHWGLVEREHVLDMQRLTEVEPGDLVSEQSRRDPMDASYRFLS